MHFDLDDGERALQQGIRELCAGRFPVERVRQGFDRDGWRALADAGVFTLRVPEADGGVGLGMTQAVLVFEELGRALVPGPLVATHLAGRDDVVGFVDVRSTPLLLEYPDDVDHVVVLGERVEMAAAPVAQRVDGLDPLTPVARLASIPQGEPLEGADAEQWRLEGTVLTAALQLGTATKLRFMAVDYAKKREQFGRPIGGFQAVKHMCADMLVREEVARAAVYAAGVICDDPSAGDPHRAAATAKITADEAAYRNGKACLQVHGGMGYTWEVDVHRYLKRAVVYRTHFAGDHAETMAATL